MTIMFLSHNLFQSPAVLVCYDDAADAAAATAAAEAAAAEAARIAAEAANTSDKRFTQDEVNKFVAEEKRKQQAALAKTEQTYKDLLANNQNLSAQERKTLEENLAVVQGQLRTKEQQAALEKKQLEEQYSGKLTEAEKKAKYWEDQYRDSSIQRALLDAAVSNDAYSPDQVVTLLKQNTKLVEDTDAAGKATGKFKVVVDFEDTDATTGERIQTTRTPSDAVKRMKEIDSFANLFKSNVVSGIGGNSSAGLPQGANGKPNLKELAKNPELFRKVMKENPSVIMGTSRK